jgi:hypothetical protein
MHAPRLISRSTAIVLTGLSARSFDGCYGGRLATESKYTGGREFVVRESLEAAIGRPITWEDVIEAERRLEPQRRRQAEYRSRRDAAA